MKHTIALLYVLTCFVFGLAQASSRVCVSGELLLVAAEIKLSAVESKAMKDAAVEIAYVSQAEPAAIAKIISGEIDKLKTPQLDVLLTKYSSALKQDKLSPLVLEYVQDLYYAVATRRDIPPSVVQDNVGYGSSAQRSYRTTLQSLRKRR